MPKRDIKQSAELQEGQSTAKEWLEEYLEDSLPVNQVNVNWPESEGHEGKVHGEGKNGFTYKHNRWTVHTWVMRGSDKKFKVRVQFVRLGTPKVDHSWKDIEAGIDPYGKQREVPNWYDIKNVLYAAYGIEKKKK